MARSSEIRDADDRTLLERLGETKQELFNLRFQHVTGQLDSLSDQHRTCVYRVVQESLTNCVRHARAAHITVAVRADDTALEVSVSDDGVGLDPTRRSSGFGLRGIEERVRELNGSVTLRSVSGKGATLAIWLPLTAVEPALARTAG